MAAKTKTAAADPPEKTGERVTDREVGWLGSRNNPHADADFALTSGPDAPVDPPDPEPEPPDGGNGGETEPPED